MVIKAEIASVASWALFFQAAVFSGMSEVAPRKEIKSISSGKSPLSKRREHSEPGCSGLCIPHPPANPGTQACNHCRCSCCHCGCVLVSAIIPLRIQSSYNTHSEMSCCLSSDSSVLCSPFLSTCKNNPLCLCSRPHQLSSPPPHEGLFLKASHNILWAETDDRSSD